jgi:hypothetical protein
MNNLLVYQYNNGPQRPWHAPSHQSISSWAESIGADYRWFSGYLPLPHASPYFGTFAPLVLKEDGTPIWEKYDALLYLDTDILANPGHLALPPEEDPALEKAQSIAMLHLLDGRLVPGKREAVCEHLRELAPDLIDRGGHCNAGVVYFPPGSIRPFADWLRIHFHDLAEWSSQAHPSLPDGHKPFGGFDQTIFASYFIDCKPAHKLPPAWNYHLAQFDPEKRHTAHFIHYHHDHKSLLLEDWQHFRPEGDIDAQIGELPDDNGPT